MGDPHSRFSQFDNKRIPRSGPQPLSQKLRFMDTMQAKPNLDNFATSKQQQGRKASESRGSGSSNTASSLLIRRPIASNSRVKQVEQTRKDMYLAFVKDALQQMANGVSDPFDELVNQFSPKRSSTEVPFPQPAQLRLWLLALSHVVSRLERGHATLVEAIVNMPWVTMDNATVKSYTVFIGMLLSAKPEYLSLVLGKIALGFTHQAGLQALSASQPETSSSPLTRRVVYDRLHYLLRHLLSLIPTLPSTLMPLLSHNFPHKRQHQIAQTTYIRNMLRVSSYCPEVADQILGVIVDRAIQIDVEIQAEIEEIEEEEPIQGQEDVFELDPFDILIGQEGEESDTSDSSDEEGEGNFSDISSDAGSDIGDGDKPVIELPVNYKHLQEMVKKLDAILTLIFDHFQSAYVAIARANASESMRESGIAGPPSSPLPELPPLPPIATSIGLINPFLIDSAIPSPIVDASLSSSQPPPSNQAQLAQLNQLASTTSCPSTPSLDRTPNSLAIPHQIPLPPPTKNHLRTQFHTLLSIFDRTILRTFRSRYTQFLLFWYTSLDSEFADLFQGMLVDRALFQMGDVAFSGGGAPAPTPVVTRAAAASYIGSFVSRAKFVDREGARRVVGVLCEFLKAHLDGVDSILSAANAAANSQTAYAALEALNVMGDQNTVFYAVSQALFLIFCFRWRDLLDEDEEEEDIMTRHADSKDGGAKKWMKELGVVQRVVNSVLNPLKACSPNVALQFARIAHVTDFIYCYPILEANRRGDNISSLGETHSRQINLSALHDGLNTEINTFFPFDPYKLPKSGVYIQEVYREWSAVAIDEDDDDDDEEEDEGDDDERRVTEEYGIPISTDGVQQTGDDTVLGASFDAMSISPAKPGLQAVDSLQVL